MPKIAMLFITTTGIPIGDALVEVRLTRTDFDDKTSGVLMNRLESFRTEADGSLLAELAACKALYHVTAYDTVQDIAIHCDFYVPESDDPNMVYQLKDITVPEGTYMSSVPFDETAMLAIIEARNAAKAAAAQAKASEIVAVDAAAVATASMVSVQENATKVEDWASEIGRQHIEISTWADQTAADRLAAQSAATAADAARSAAVVSASAAATSASGAATSEANAKESARLAYLDSQSATAANTGAEASAARAAQEAVRAQGHAESAAFAAESTMDDRRAVAANAANVQSWKDEVAANKVIVQTNTDAARDYKDQGYLYMGNAQASAVAAANSGTAANVSATNAEASKVAAAASAKTAADRSADAATSATTANVSAVAAASSATAAAQSAAEANAAMVNKLDKTDAVVAPAANKVPRAAASGYIDPAWLDPNKPWVTLQPLGVGLGGMSRYGINLAHPGTPNQALYKIATLPSEDLGSYTTVHISGILGAWQSSATSAISATIGNRSGIYLDWSISRNTPETARLLLYKDSDSSYSLYLMFTAGSYSHAALQIISSGATTYSTYTAATSAPGVLVWDSGTAPNTAGYVSPRCKGINGASNPYEVNGTSFDTYMELRSRDSDRDVTSFWSAGARQGTVAAATILETMRWGISRQPGINYPGFFTMGISSGDPGVYKEGFRLSYRAYDTYSQAYTNPLLAITGGGLVYMYTLKAGSADRSTSYHCISRGVTAGDLILLVGRDSESGSTSFAVADTFSWNSARTVMYVGAVSATGRSLNAAGTVNTGGNDYAEYIYKMVGCGDITKGAIIAITKDNKISDKWENGVMFAIKSTDPSFVGGDTWAADLGTAPQAKAGEKPSAPARKLDTLKELVEGVVEDPILQKGDSDEEWASKQAEYATLYAEWEAAVASDKADAEAFNVKLEEARQRVDRIAIAGRVPVNVWGASPGDYIVPVQDGEGIKGVAVKEDDMTLKQYLRAVGQVISIEEDGRAYVMVKAV